MRNGKLSLGFGGGVNLTTEPLINDSAWHHVVVSLPTGSTYADETIVYLDGNPVLFEESVAFSPEEYSTSLWLDSSDLTSISHSSDSIHEWRDKSGNDFHAIQSTLTKKPTLILSGLDEKPVVNFDGTDDSISSTSLNISQSYSIFIVAKTNNNETGRDYIFDGAISSARSLVALDESGKIKMWAGWDNGGWQDSTFSTPDGYFVMTAVFDTTNSLLGLNGTSTSSLNLGTSNLTNGITIGANAGTTSDFFDGSIAEFIILDETVSSTSQNEIEGYLANKWGLLSNLPSDHPFVMQPSNTIIQTGTIVTYL